MWLKADLDQVARAKLVEERIFADPRPALSELREHLRLLAPLPDPPASPPLRVVVPVSAFFPPSNLGFQGPQPHHQAPPNYVPSIAEAQRFLQSPTQMPLLQPRFTSMQPQSQGHFSENSSFYNDLQQQPYVPNGLYNSTGTPPLSVPLQPIPPPLPMSNGARAFQVPLAGETKTILRARPRKGPAMPNGQPREDCKFCVVHHQMGACPVLDYRCELNCPLGHEHLGLSEVNDRRHRVFARKQYLDRRQFWAKYDKKRDRLAKKVCNAIDKADLEKLRRGRTPWNGSSLGQAESESASTRVAQYTSTYQDPNHLIHGQSAPRSATNLDPATLAYLDSLNALNEANNQWDHHTMPGTQYNHSQYQFLDPNQQQYPPSSQGGSNNFPSLARCGRLPRQKSLEMRKRIILGVPKIKKSR
ncbi:hypothetical protein T439DRAFT_172047 [Meredithblackwellia eburnea MCA 4105]